MASGNVSSFSEAIVQQYLQRIGEKILRVEETMGDLEDKLDGATIRAGTCDYCGNVFLVDSRGSCMACGAPPPKRWSVSHAMQFVPPMHKYIVASTDEYVPGLEQKVEETLGGPVLTLPPWSRLLFSEASS